MTKPATFNTAPSPPIPGLNMQLGLRHVGGNEALYLKLLRRFTRDYAGLTPRVEAMLATDDWDAAVREAHTFKGLSATFGASELTLLATDLEKALVSRSLHDALEKLAATGAAFAVMAAALDAKFAADDANIAALTRNPGDPSDPSDPSDLASISS